MKTQATGVAVAFAAALAVAGQPHTTSDLPPLDVARILATRYPEEVSMGYIPALAWSGALRLSALTGEARWEQKARREMHPFISGEKAAIAPPYMLANLAGLLALSDLGAAEGNAAAAGLAGLPPPAAHDGRACLGHRVAVDWCAIDRV